MLFGLAGGTISSSNPSDFSWSRGIDRTFVGVEGPGVAGVEAVVIIGVNRSGWPASSTRDIESVCMVSTSPLRYLLLQYRSTILVRFMEWNVAKWTEENV